MCVLKVCRVSALAHATLDGQRVCGSLPRERTGACDLTQTSQHSNSTLTRARSLTCIHTTALPRSRAAKLTQLPRQMICPWYLLCHSSIRKNLALAWLQIPVCSKMKMSNAGSRCAPSTMRSAESSRGNTKRAMRRWLSATSHRTVTLCRACTAPPTPMSHTTQCVTVYAQGDSTCHYLHHKGLGAQTR